MEILTKEMDIIGNDEAVIATNDDSSCCKRYAVDLGYYKDPFIRYFVRATDRKAPEINRGYFARTNAIQILIEKFIDVSLVNILKYFWFVLRIKWNLGSGL